MRFANFLVDGQATVVAIAPDGRSFWPIDQMLPGFTGDMLDFVRACETRPQLSLPAQIGWTTALAVPLAPFYRLPRNIFCVGKNYHDHAAEFQKSGYDLSAKEGEHAPEAPVIFTKAASSMIGPGAKIPRHAGVTDQLDYEAELGVVIGRRGFGIKKSDAMKHIFGYTIINDVTARDLQKRHRQWFLGKSLDGFCPMGPHIVTADEVDGQKLCIRCSVNNELRQDSHTGQLIFDIPTLIETLSAGIELEPGDVIATGTPAGVGIGFAPPQFLRSGDVVRIEIEGLGVLENEVD